MVISANRSEGQKKRNGKKGIQCWNETRRASSAETPELDARKSAQTLNIIRSWSGSR